MNSNIYDKTGFQNGDLLALTALFALTGLLIYLVPVPLLRIPFGTFCIFYAPGYALLAALYPSKKGISRGQRFLAAVGLSVVVTGLLGLAITYSVGTSLNTTFLALLAWVVSMVLIARYRRASISPSERFVPRVKIQLAFPQTSLQKWLSLAQVAAIVLLILAGGRLLWVSVQSTPQFTEFYLLGDEGLAADYPEHAVIGSPITTNVGIKNHEDVETTYQLAYRINEGPEKFITSIVLDHEEQWESEVAIYPLELPGTQKITFFLSKGPENTTYHQSHIWVSVSDTK